MNADVETRQLIAIDSKKNIKTLVSNAHQGFD
jgi:hypothetical protein